jgi:hypothetical protein
VDKLFDFGMMPPGQATAADEVAASGANQDRERQARARVDDQPEPQFDFVQYVHDAIIERKFQGGDVVKPQSSAAN